MEKINPTATKMLALFVALLLLIFAGCSSIPASGGGIPTPSPGSSLEPGASSMVLEELCPQAAAYYPDEVSFQFARLDKITDEATQGSFVGQECYLFDVTFEGKKVSGVAVGVEDGSIWVLDMNAENLWLSERFMGLPQSANAEVPKREPVIKLMSRIQNGEEVLLYFARLNTIPELSGQNEGTLRWNEKEQTLAIRAVKATGSVTGAIDGPLINAVITWKTGVPELVAVEYEPAPTFSYPGHVLLSGEIMSIETGRLLEIAEHLKALVQETLNATNSQ